MDEQGQGDELYPIAVLIDELKVGPRVRGREGSRRILNHDHSTTTSSSA